VNQVLQKLHKVLKGVMEYSDLPLVSSDYRGHDALNCGCQFDNMGGDLLKVGLVRQRVGANG